MAKNKEMKEEELSEKLLQSFRDLQSSELDPPEQDHLEELLHQGEHCAVEIALQEINRHNKSQLEWTTAAVNPVAAALRKLLMDCHALRTHLEDYRSLRLNTYREPLVLEFRVQAGARLEKRYKPGSHEMPMQKFLQSTASYQAAHDGSSMLSGREIFDGLVSLWREESLEDSSREKLAALFPGVRIQGTQECIIFSLS